MQCKGLAVWQNRPEDNCYSVVKDSIYLQRVRTSVVVCYVHTAAVDMISRRGVQG